MSGVSFKYLLKSKSFKFIKDKSNIKENKFITGERCGNKDFELLSYIDDIGFNIAMRKDIDKKTIYV